MNILYLASEHAGLVKVGGLADVAASLPAALARRGHQVRVLLPLYGCLRDRAGGAMRQIVHVPGGALYAWRAGRRDLQVWLSDLPAFRDRGHPYQREDGSAWPDEAVAWNAFGQLAAAMAGDRLGLGWHAEVIHANDWMCGLAPLHALLSRVPAATVFTIHSLAHQGLFAAEVGAALGLPGWIGHPEAMEFHGALSFMKAGLVFSDRLTTVSPSYAAEILTPVAGEGLDGVLRTRAGRLTGILNGIDTRHWDPRRDRVIAAPFGPRRMAGRTACREALREETGLTGETGVAVAAFVGRLVPQKGVDMLIEALPQLLERRLALVVLGRGEAGLERALAAAARAHPGRVHVRLAHDEDLARRMFAGADMLLMPSRFEPCGLTQMYAMRYGAVPVASAVGGLRDTIADPTDAADRATGFLYGQVDAAGLVAAVDRALDAFARPAQWTKLVRNGMARDFAWGDRAREHEAVYADAMHLLRGPRPAPG